jgi:hypothetical protein
MTKREAINLFRKELQERNADSEYTNKDLYANLLSQAKWLIKREVSAGRIYRNTGFFQTLRAMDVIEVSTIPAHLSIPTNCRIYRTRDKLPEMWMDNDGPVVKRVTSLDGSTSFQITTPTAWEDISKDPYEKYSSTKYTFFSDGYFWFPKDNPHKANFEIFPVDDIILMKPTCKDCDDDSECIRFLDTKFLIPDWIEAEMYSKALQALFPSKQMQDDNDINKNPTRKN